MKIGDLGEGDLVLVTIDGRDLEALVMRVGDPKWPGLHGAARLTFPAHPGIRSKWVPIADLKETI